MSGTLVAALPLCDLLFVFLDALSGLFPVPGDHGALERS
jgi:hypothetical protein